jgi:signal transduction histidine kinase
MGLGIRFAVVIGTVTLLTGGVLVGGFIRVERRYLIDEGHRMYQTNANHLAHLCAESLANNDQLGLINFMKELRLSKSLREGFCVDGSGKVMAHSDLQWLGKTFKKYAPPWDMNLTEQPDGNNWVYRKVAVRNSRPVVLARLVYDGQGVLESVETRLRSMIHRSLTLGMGVLVLALLLSWATARALTGPIRKLARGVHRVGGGDWAARVPETGPGELGDLAKEFNRMSLRLGDLDRLKDMFINNVSHDLRNPLSAIATSAKILRAENTSETASPLLRVIETSALRLRAMVNNILDTAKMREGRLVYEKTIFNPQKMCEELGTLFTPVAFKAGKKLVLDIPADIPALNADEEKVMRVLLNLLSNAFKFTKEGDTISLTARPTNGWIEFRVSDTGWGIPADRLERIFEPFHSTTDSPNAPPKQGTGLGLSIVKALVDGHGGRVTVRSELKKGTVFTVTFPVATESA